MKVSGTHLLQAPRERVWEALRDPAVLSGAIPGCETLEAVSADEYRARVRGRVAAVDGVYDVRIASSDPQPVTSCTLRVVAGGDPGTVDATVVLRLDDGDGTTQVSYDADAVIGGAVGGVGQRVLVGVAQRNASAFFAAVDRWLAGEALAEAATPASAATGPQAVSPPPAHPGDGRVEYRPGHPTKVSHPQHLLVAALAGAAIALLGVAVAGRRRS